MKKTGILNSEITKVLTDLGHTDSICIADAGLPVPDGVKKIDLALKRGMPSFLETLNVVLGDMWIENAYLAEEIKTKNTDVLIGVKQVIQPQIIKYVSHEEFKKLAKSCKVVIRTGEMTPYANIILTSNVN